MRGTGQTSKQIENAPKDAIYVCYGYHGFTVEKDIVKRLGRNDIRLVDRYWIQSSKLHGLRRPIVVDHAVELTDHQQELIDVHNCIVRCDD